MSLLFKHLQNSPTYGREPKRAPRLLRPRGGHIRRRRGGRCRRQERRFRVGVPLRRVITSVGSRYQRGSAGAVSPLPFRVPIKGRPSLVLGTDYAATVDGTRSEARSLRTYVATLTSHNNPPLLTQRRPQSHQVHRTSQIRTARTRGPKGSRRRVSSSPARRVHPLARAARFRRRRDTSTCKTNDARGAGLGVRGRVAAPPRAATWIFHRRVAAPPWGATWIFRRRVAAPPRGGYSEGGSTEISTPPRYIRMPSLLSTDLQARDLARRAA